MPSKKKKLGKKKPTLQKPQVGRETLFTPWRSTYIKKGAIPEKPGGCVFCEALEVGVSKESLIVFKGEHASVILNRFPYNTGHTMIIPNRHLSSLSTLSVEIFTELNGLLKKTCGAIEKTYGPQGINIGMNLGRAGGAGIVDHLHYHLVPRWVGDTNFMPVIGQTKVISETLEETYEKLITSFS